MIRLFALLFILMASSAQAADKEFSIFGGGGISTGKSTMSGVSTGAASSKFTTQGYFLEGGMNIPFSGDLEFYALKLGLYVRQFAFGVGYRHHDLTIKSISLDSDQYLENNYKGFTPMAYGGFSVEFKQRYRAAVEGQ